MVLLRHLVKMLGAVVAYSIASRRIGVLMLVVLGLVLVLVATASQAAAPFVLYPFA